jgi:hypothetical protein
MRRNGTKNTNQGASVGQVAIKPININREKSKAAEFTKKQRIRNYVGSIT